MKIINPKIALHKIQRYCAYQERCHQEVRDKLYSFGLRKNEVENIIATLIQDNFINEERFAILYAGGKFRVKNWGKRKIEYELKGRKISVYCIKKALNSIDEQEYQDVIIKLIKKKNSVLKKDETFIKKHKVAQYVIHKGFETELVWQLIESNMK